MIFCDYKIVESVGTELMIREVKELMAAGWIPLGGVCAVKLDSQCFGKVSVGQAMGLPAEEDVFRAAEVKQKTRAKGGV